MKLLTLKEFSGTTANAGALARSVFPTKSEITSVVTNLPLGAALSRLRQHSNAYKAKYEQLYVEYQLIGVHEIDDLSEDELYSGMLRMVEKLATRVEEF